MEHEQVEGQHREDEGREHDPRQPAAGHGHLIVAGYFLWLAGWLTVHCGPRSRVERREDGGLIDGKPRAW
jgi:hypothetical protein